MPGSRDDVPTLGTIARASAMILPPRYPVAPTTTSLCSIGSGNFRCGHLSGVWVRVRPRRAIVGVPRSGHRTETGARPCCKGWFAGTLRVNLTASTDRPELQTENGQRSAAANAAETAAAAEASAYRNAYTGWLRSLPHYFRASTLRMLLRDLYYGLPLPSRVKWALRNRIVRNFKRGRLRVGSYGEGVAGPWSAALALSKRVDAGSAAVQEIVRRPELLREHALPSAAAPVVSVIIPVHNKIEYTIACLLSIRFNRPEVGFEVIVVDDASTDDTAALLAPWPGLRYVRNAENLGFIGACNRGAGLAKGRYLCFLNNDTNVLHGWLDELVWTFDNVPGTGLAGSKLVYPSGELQEAGGIVWRDASAWNYGHLTDPDQPGASYLRDVDYVSGASILIRAEDFAALGGFDVRYRPAYYEDSDLAFRMRETGKRVVVQPASMVVHYEGVSSGRAPTDAVKRFQTINQGKFYERWKLVLARHRRYGNSPESEKERRVAKRLLMVDAHMPFPDRDAGSVTADHYIRIFQQLGYKVTFAPENLRFDPKYTARLQRRGVECLYYPFEHDLRDVLRRRGREFDLVFVSRPYVADKIRRRLRAACPRAKVIYNTVDLHFIRELRQSVIERNPALARRADQTREQELRASAAADCTIVISPAEEAILRRELPQVRIEVIQLIHEEQPAGLPFAARRGLVFIGGAQHPPNLDAVRHFVSDVMPALRAAGSSHGFSVIGSQPAQVHDLACDDVSVLGQVDDITPHFQGALCMVVPLRYGAGVKGKIGTAFSYGLPVISTGVGVEGMDLTEDTEYLQAENASDWVRQIRRLSEDEALWMRLSEAGRRIVRERYSPGRVADRLRDIIATL
ncbi:MAG: glycosyltransferase [Betaproteobacteria bacterium]|nr:MAG: glycosyltransferase [Betaproteobacteria bacterium]